MSKVEYYRAIRDDAIERGDMGIARAVSADLRRWGVAESAAQAPPPEKRRAGRPPKPRCEHNRIAERCFECQQAEIEDGV